MTKAKPKTAAIYARYSTDKQHDTSVKRQTDDCDRYAAREGIKVVARFADHAKSSATLFDRDNALAMLADAKRHRFDVVIAENIDRLSRDAADLHGMWKVFQVEGIELHTLVQGVIRDPMIVGFNAIQGEMFLRNLAYTVRQQHANKARAGNFPGAIPFGYRRKPGTKGELEIDPAKVEIVRRIFREYINGMSPRVIARRLNDEGVPAPTADRKRPRPWS